MSESRSNIERPNVAFSGLTAAGKTTHAQILAEQLGYDYVCAGQVMLDILDMSRSVEGVWFSEYDKIAEAREGDKVDMELDARLKQMADDRDGVVFDTWAMGWIYDGPLVRIWLDSDIPSRTRKSFVSQGENQELDLRGCQDLLAQKDGSTRETFRRLHGFDLFEDRDRYDAIICNTDLIPQPTAEASAEGIRTFTPVVHDVATYLIEQALGENQQTAADIHARHGSMILRLEESPWSFD